MDTAFSWTPDTPEVKTLHEKVIGTDPAENGRQTMKIDVLAMLEQPL